MLLMFDQLSQLELFIDLPVILASLLRTKSLAKVGGDRRKVRAKPVGGNGWHAVRVKALLKIMHRGLPILVFATPQMNSRQRFGDRINHHP